MEPTNKKRIWSKEELTIAYYIAKWNYSGLDVTIDELVNDVIGNTTESSLLKQIANFRYLLDIDGYRLKNFSKAMEELSNELKDKTITNVRKLIIDYIEVRSLVIKENKIIQSNISVNEKKEELNSQMEINFNNKVKMISQFRKLKPIGRRIKI